MSSKARLIPYIGPGIPLILSPLWAILVFLLSLAGILLLPFRHLFRFIRRRKKIFIPLFLLLLLIVTIMLMSRKNNPSRTVILCLDGLSANQLEKMMEEGKLPNFQKLKTEGSYARLVPPVPVESSVAWVSFITASSPGEHGVFDFLQPNFPSYLPELTLFKSLPPSSKLTVGKYQFPLTSTRFQRPWRGVPFWEYTSSQKIPVQIFFLPMTFPPPHLRGRIISGFGTPDIKGTLGTFTFYTEEGKGENVVKVTFTGNRAETFVEGPRNPYLKEVTYVRIPLILEKEGNKLKITLGKKSLSLKEKEWSDWVEVNFSLLPGIRVHTIAKFYLKKITPLKLYLTPLNPHPSQPPYPLSYPRNFSSRLARTLGLFYTQGQPGETRALNEGYLEEKDILPEYRRILREREEMLYHALENFSGGILVFYFGITDVIQHIFYRFLDPQHPYYEDNPEFREVIPWLYQEVDRILGEVRKRMGNGYLFVISDHGFSTFRRSVNLNTWLWEEGYLHLSHPPSPGNEFFRDVVWERTKAYSLGLGGEIYINRKGREEFGIVEENEVDSLVAEIKKKLEYLVDPLTGEKIVRRVYLGKKIYKGEEENKSPEIIVGFRAGYRASWESALGGVRERVFEDNLKPWSGDHIFDPREVPGIFFTNIKIKEREVHMENIMPTILKINNLSLPPHFKGKSLNFTPP